MNLLKRFFKAVESVAVDIILHRIIVPTILITLYFVAVGLTSIFAKIFARRHLAHEQLENSNWVKAVGFEVTELNKTHQS